MLDERQKKLAAAIIAVREGRITATEAAALVQDPKATAGDLLGGGNGDTKRLDDAQLLESALQGAGMSSEETKLFSTADEAKADQLVRKTLFNVAPTMPPENSSTERPSTTRLRRPSRITERERYTIKREFARGGQGRIMIARDNVVGREVALKELLPELDAQGGQGTPATAAHETIGAVERFLREAKVTGQLEHPNVVPVYEIGRHESGSLYYTMKFVRGQTMAERLRDIDRLQLPRERRLALRLKLLEAFSGICNAVAFAHSRGVIHRDLKPQNIMVGDFGETVLLDWGLARVKGQEDKIGRQLTLVATNMLSESLMRQNADGLTVDGTVFGTPHYMPPEQARADLKEIDEQSDVYSLGAILYEILTGAPPYDGPTSGHILQQVLSGPPRKIRDREPHAPPDLVALCEFAMAHDKGRRMKTALQLSSEIQAYRDGTPLKVYRYGAFEQASRVLARYRGAVVAALLTLLLLIGGGASFFTVIIGEKAEADELQLAAEADRDKTNDLLAQATRARQSQLELKRREDEARQQRKREREREVTSLRQAIESMRVEPLIKDLVGRVAQYEDVEERGRDIDIESGERASNGNLLMSVIGYLAAQDTLISLLTSDEEVEPLVAADIGRQRAQMLEARLLAARLACYNSEFEQAHLLLAGADESIAAVAQTRKALKRTQDAIVALQRSRIAAALDDIAQGLTRESRKGPGLFAYIELLKGYRDQQTVQMLRQALAPLQQRARSRQGRWSRADLDTCILICRVLGKLEMAKETLPVLLEFLDSNPPAPLSVACALALCDLRSPACALPLSRFARGKGADVWSQVAPAFVQIPLPENVQRGATLDDCLCALLYQLARGDTEFAIRLGRNAVTLEPENWEAHLWLGKALARAGRPDEALEELRAAITRAPQNKRLLVERGLVFAATQRHAQAVLDFSSALMTERDNTAALMARAHSRLALREHEAALQDYMRAFELDAFNLEALLGEVAVHTARNDMNSVWQTFARILEADPYFQEAWARRGIMRRERGDQRGAIHDLTRALELKPDDWRCFSTRAQSHAVQQMWTEAFNDANAALDLDANDAQSLFVRAGVILRFAENDFNRNKALADLRRANVLDPNDFSGWMLRAEVCTALKLWDETLVAAQSARRIAPFGIMFQQHLPPENIIIFEVRARSALAATREAGSARERVFRARGLAAQGQPAGLREAVALLQGAARDAALPEGQKPFLAAAVRAAAQALVEAGFVYDALGMMALLNGIAPDDIDDCLLAARANALLAQQHREARLRLLGASDADRSALESEANGKPQDARNALSDAATDAALDCIERAAQAGLSDAAQVQSDRDLAMLRSHKRWADTLRKLGAAASDSALQARIAALKPQTVVYILKALPGGQAYAGGVRDHDVIVDVAGTKPKTIEELGPLIRRQTGPYRITFRRYALDDLGLPVPQVRDGKTVTDSFGGVEWMYEEFSVEMQPGLLGITLQLGSLARQVRVP